MAQGEEKRRGLARGSCCACLDHPFKRSRATGQAKRGGPLGRQALVLLCDCHLIPVRPERSKQPVSWHRVWSRDSKWRWSSASIHVSVEHPSVNYKELKASCTSSSNSGSIQVWVRAHKYKLAVAAYKYQLQVQPASQPRNKRAIQKIALLHEHTLV